MGKPKFRLERSTIENENINTKKISIDFLNKEYGYGFCVNVGNPHIVFL